MKSVLSDQLSVTGKKASVAVGLSGGVDSSLSAALLLEQGYDVTGVFLECWRGPGCRVDEDRKDALDIAMQLGIPFQTLDFKQQYKDKVVDYFYREYQAGRTPNPDTMCNREIKFGLFYEWAIEQEKFDYIATGHYARAAKLQAGSDNLLTDQLINSSTYFLQRGADEKKDQSYFLYQLHPEQLEHILFPIGHMTKDQVRAEAEKRGLKTAQKPDSQGICFIGQVDVREFLKERIEEEVGEVVILLVDSKELSAHATIGSHHGTPFYTIGQKVGREIDQALVAKLAKKGILNFDPTQMPPLFVIAKDIDRNILIVGTEEETYKSEFEVGEVRWLIGELTKQLISESVNQQITDSVAKQNRLTDKPINRLTNIFLRIRHGGEMVKSKLKIKNSKVVVETNKPLRGVASGQACVFYSSDSKDAIVLGGGIII